MLIGEYQHSLDAKGRLFMPAKLRDKIGEKFIITKGLKDCLFVYSMEEWEKLSAQLTKIALNNANGQKFLRLFMGGAGECEPDKQGRFIIPHNLRDYSRLEKDAVIIGLGTRVEIWSKELWESYTDVDSDLEELAESINFSF